MWFLMAILTALGSMFGGHHAPASRSQAHAARGALHAAISSGSGPVGSEQH